MFFLILLTVLYIPRSLIPKQSDPVQSSAWTFCDSFGQVHRNESAQKTDPRNTFGKSWKHNPIYRAFQANFNSYSYNSVILPEPEHETCIGARLIGFSLYWRARAIHDALFPERVHVCYNKNFHECVRKQSSEF